MPAWCPLCRREIPIPGYLLPSDIQVLPSHHAQRGRCCPEGGFPFRVAGLTARDRKLDRVQRGGLSTAVEGVMVTGWGRLTPGEWGETIGLSGE